MVRITRNKRLANLLALIGTHRDILKVRIGGTEPSRRRNSLIIRGMHKTIDRIYQCRQRIGICGFQLRQATIVEDKLYDRVLAYYLL